MRVQMVVAYTALLPACLLFCRKPKCPPPVRRIAPMAGLDFSGLVLNKYFNTTVKVTISLLATMSVLVLILLCCLLHHCVGLTQDGLRLLEAKSYLDDTYGALANWSPSDATPCNWTGVACAPPPLFPAVTALDLSDLGIAGPFPPPICRIPHLSSLSLAVNSLNSSLSSAALLGCSSLTHLDLSQNAFDGPLPAALPSLLPKVVYLDLSVNNFSGPIPSSFGELSALRRLSLLGNLLSGPFPAFLSNLSSLRELNLSYNPFTPSSIPPSLANLTSLRVLWLASCNLVGGIPSALGQLSYLTDLDLSYNSLFASLPESLAGLASAVQIELYSNELTDLVPDGLSNLTNLWLFDASMNQLSGEIPKDVFLAPKLESFNLYENNLTGPIPSTIAGCATLAELRLFSNQLSGPLPVNFGKNSQLSFVDLSNNLLSGDIPAGICDGGTLEQLLLHNNMFSGSLPESLGRCSTLTRVRLLNNRLSGEVPPALWGLPHVWFLDLAGNSFTGSISPAISSSSNLSKLVISNNQFEGVIPEEMGALSNLYELSAAWNQLTGPLPEGLLRLAALGQLDLHGNALSGELPRGIQSWKKLIQLNLADNEFTGSIPPELGDLPVLNYLDLSGNKLTGEIPIQLQNLKLNQLNFSNNKLSGSLPSFFSKQIYETSFLGNPELCVNNALAEHCHGGRRSNSNGHGFTWFLRSIYVLSAMVILAAVAWFYWKNSKKLNHGNMEKTNGILTSFHKLSFSKYEILNFLNEDNVIGSGASGKVYKAMLSNGQVVAAKKLQKTTVVDDVAGDRFETEVARLGKISHKNIVKLWCCCMHDDYKLLVYEYMPNRSLSDFLHCTNGRLLEWPVRYKIALDAAEGLSYLHHDCVPPIIHQGVKSNNILLDEEFGAKVADSGVSKFIGRGPKSASFIAGSCGYTAPEYAYTLHLNEKSDIYSFGVVLLELVTGRCPVDPELEEEYLVKWVCNIMKHKGVDHVFDSKLNSSFKEQMCKVLSVGLLCTSHLPVNRPSMRRVVNMLLEADSENNCKPTREFNLSLATYKNSFVRGNTSS
ncbi:receptor-like protein kinase HSL1 [Canna indica]|uniref:non-specific serine/threonine protein kinase n=1 Tax=Canna indica TaxID=4628 RepID=A0AAQ3KTS0_9LILI|nr:receptor-like protein kinase HSL1 [Canna indica]